ncbi:MAG: PQQ-binding-like beta-propeller repeat protein [Pirellulales bacterium]|nr:PQQ-binding-like beta-propeller repeat protein [Pirellulales bacterium]
MKRIAPRSEWMVRALLLTVLLGCTCLGRAADWPQWGGSPARNNTPDGKDIPVEWNVGDFDYRTGKWLPEGAKNILWVAQLGSQSYGSPVIAGGRVYCATNNGAGYLPRYPSDVDLGCLLCFRQRDGRFGWQLSREKLEAGRAVDWPDQGICCSPVVEDERLWVVTNRGEVACLDADGFYDGENDGPYTSEPNNAHNEADVVWLFDMMRQLGSVQHNMASCSVTAAGDLLLVNTSNGVDESHKRIPAPDAPSFIALDKKTGELVWADNSPGRNLLHGQWGSPAFAVLGDVPQAIFPGGDGWLYSFRAERTDTGKPELLWKFDCNPKESKWREAGAGDRSNLIATPVVCEGKVYIATGQDPEHGEGQGHLWCIDPTKRGDVSPELVFDEDGKPIPPRRILAADKEAGDVVRPNPKSAAIWHYTGHDANGDGRFDFEETMHRTLGMAAIRDNLLVIADLAGLFHCLDARTGKVHWTYDMLATMWGSPLVVDGKVYIGDEDGDVAVFELSPQMKLLAENSVGDSIYSAGVVVDDVLYIATRSHLIAIKQQP